MKKGFVSTLTLLVLEREPMHGRQIKGAIEERTFGVWTPTDSTMYTILKDLREKGLIQQQNEDEKVIVYEITDDGKNTLKIMMNRSKQATASGAGTDQPPPDKTENNIDTVISSFPIIESLLLGNYIKNCRDIKFILDYRDGMTFEPLEKSTIFFLQSRHIFNFVCGFTVYNLAVRCLNKTKFIHLSKSGKGDNQTDIRPFRGFNRTNTAVMSGMYVTNFESRPFSGQSARPQGA